jgi:hypothetical protein
MRSTIGMSVVTSVTLPGQSSVQTGRPSTLILAEASTRTPIATSSKNGFSHYLPFLTMSSDVRQLSRSTGRFRSQRGRRAGIARHSLLAYRLLRNLWCRWSDGAAWYWTNMDKPPGANIRGLLGAVTVMETPTSPQRPHVFVEGNDYNLWCRWSDGATCSG